MRTDPRATMKKRVRFPRAIDPARRGQGHSFTDASDACDRTPQGTGTALIECLTSYVARLAASHGVSPSALLSSTVAPVIGKKYWLQGGARDGTTGSALSKSFNIHTRAINGIGVIASDWVQTLQTLTLRNDLAQLTMLKWQSVFSQYGSVI